MCKVYNKRDGAIPDGAVYIGRGSLYSNPYKIGEDGDRDEVCDKFEDLVMRDYVRYHRIVRDLIGRDLVCFCAPLRCHGDTILKIANKVGE